MTARIRSLTVHGVLDTWDDADHVARVLGSLTQTAKRLSRLVEERAGVEVWTVRVSLPPLPRKAVTSIVEGWRLARSRGLVDDETLYSLYHVASSDAVVDDIKTILSLGGNVYASVSSQDAGEAAKIIYSVAMLGPDMSSRVSVTIPDHVETPYFPSSTTLSSTPGVSIALLYPSLLRGSGIWGSYRKLVDLATRIEKAVVEAIRGSGVDWLEFYGFDLSLSPWMDDSVAGVLEEASGSRVGEPGFASAIAEAELLIEAVCMETTCTGFNQVMLPVAEDNVLKRRVVEGKLTLSLLSAYSYACVAGVDMVLVSSSDWSLRLAAGIARDLYMASARKGAPLAARIIVVDAKPGERLSLPRFGDTPVIRVV